MKNPKQIRGYHFTGDTLRDGRPIPKVGDWLVHEGPVEPCSQGLHASKHPFDALQYAPGSRLHRVILRKGLKSHGPIDKYVGKERKIIASIDAEKLLRDFARWCALQVIHLWDAPDLVKKYLETGDENLRRAARAAARDAAWVAARDAARVAARAAERAAEDAWVAWDAAGAAGDAAWVAARDAAWVAARDAARVAEDAWVAGDAAGAAGDAAWVAARDAAWVAARVAARVAAGDAAGAAGDAAWVAAGDAAFKKLTKRARNKFAAMTKEAFRQ